MKSFNFYHIFVFTITLIIAIMFTSTKHIQSFVC